MERLPDPKKIESSLVGLVIDLLIGLVIALLTDLTVDFLLAERDENSPAE